MCPPSGPPNDHGCDDGCRIVSDLAPGHVRRRQLCNPTPRGSYRFGHCGAWRPDKQATGWRRDCADSRPAAATLKSKVATEDTPLTQPEQALLQQWLTALADTPALEPSTPKRRSPSGKREK